MIIINAPTSMSGVNPYESPIIPEEDADPLGGPWRMGTLLVMDVRLELPRVCVFSGMEADGAREVTITGRRAGELFTSKFTIWIPLRSVHLNRYRRSRIQALIGMGLSAFSMLGLIGLWPFVNHLQDLFVCALIPLLLMGLVGTSLWYVFRFQAQSPLQFVRATDNLLWLSGASSTFLATLPEWPNWKPTKA